MSKGSLSRKDQKKRDMDIVKTRKANPNLSEGKIAKQFGVNQSTIHRVLKKYEKEFDIVEDDVGIWTENKEVILEGTIKKLIIQLNNNMSDLKAREIAYTVDKLDGILARERGQFSGSGDIGAILGLIDDATNGRLKKIQDGDKLKKQEAATIIEAEVIEDVQ